MQQLSDKMVKKKDSKGIAVFLREGISFLWGIAKNYIMYWGVTSSIITRPLHYNNPKNSQILQKSNFVFVSFAQTTLQILLL